MKSFFRLKGDRRSESLQFYLGGLIMRGLFFVFKRTMPSGRKIYYYQTYKPDGMLTTAKSTGCTQRKLAVNYYQKLLLEGKLWAGSNMSFKQYNHQH